MSAKILILELQVKNSNQPAFFSHSTNSKNSTFLNYNTFSYSLSILVYLFQSYFYIYSLGIVFSFLILHLKGFYNYFVTVPEVLSCQNNSISCFYFTIFWMISFFLHILLIFLFSFHNMFLPSFMIKFFT